MRSSYTLSQGMVLHSHAGVLACHPLVRKINNLLCAHGPSTCSH